MNFSQIVVQAICLGRSLLDFLLGGWASASIVDSSLFSATVPITTRASITECCLPSYTPVTPPTNAAETSTTMPSWSSAPSPRQMPTPYRTVPFCLTSSSHWGNAHDRIPQTLLGINSLLNLSIVRFMLVNVFILRLFWLWICDLLIFF